MGWKGGFQSLQVSVVPEGKQIHKYKNYMWIFQVCAFNAGGKQSLQVHAVTKKHKYNADGRKGRVQGQVSVVAPLAGDTDEEYNNMNSEVTEEEQERPGQAIAEVG